MNARPCQRINSYSSNILGELKNLDEWCNSPENNIDCRKKLVIAKLIEYVKSIPPRGWMLTVFSNVDETPYTFFNKIVDALSLPTDRFFAEIIALESNKESNFYKMVITWAIDEQQYYLNEQHKRQVAFKIKGVQVVSILAMTYFAWDAPLLAVPLMNLIAHSPIIPNQLRTKLEFVNDKLQSALQKSPELLKQLATKFGSRIDPNFIAGGVLLLHLARSVTPTVFFSAGYIFHETAESWFDASPDDKDSKTAASLGR